MNAIKVLREMRTEYNDAVKDSGMREREDRRTDYFDGKAVAMQSLVVRLFGVSNQAAFEVLGGYVEPEEFLEDVTAARLEVL